MEKIADSRNPLLDVDTSIQRITKALKVESTVRLVEDVTDQNASQFTQMAETSTIPNRTQDKCLLMANIPETELLTVIIQTKEVLRGKYARMESNADTKPLLVERFTQLHK